ncbi:MULTISPECIES: hypothetical protein [unclassified Marinobacter]|uniref:hypothetical protein n=1 Tax=unclassified Marinobacter TaxID=83889 RepID=UPI000BF78AF5|nr:MULTISPECIES: hypothetical protein [unclassified Marinobacter]PFG09308.1 hypothetical protein ATI45_1677 [Marinobacter sp. LV10MA510-1]PFG51232.1 hypothetical protein ATG98_0160 [Marinobacter sp. LV10R520-4]
MLQELVGYHGTNTEAVDFILTENFRVSAGEDEWLGHGVYLFTKGVSCPIQNAVEWAKNQAYSREGNRYDSYTVLEATARCSRLLDLRYFEGLSAFDTVREKILEKHDKHFARNRRIKNDNRVMWNLVAQMMNLEVIIHSVYIKNRIQRIKRIDSNVQNTTVMCVKDPNSIDVETIKVFSSGAV